MLENMLIRGCNTTAVVVDPDPTTETGPPVVLRNVTFEANTGGALEERARVRMGGGVAEAAAAAEKSAAAARAAGSAAPGVALDIQPRASVEMEGCRVTGNAAAGLGGAAVVVGERANLTVLSSAFTGNTGSALLFKGSTLVVLDCLFEGNSALEGAALRLQGDGAGGVGSVASFAALANTTFAGNAAAARGGALLSGAGVTLSLGACNFTGNAALAGGGLYVEPAGCLDSLANTRFISNEARGGPAAEGVPISPGSGGGLVIMGAQCGSDWQGVTFRNNSATADGGGAYLNQLSNKRVLITGEAAVAVALKGFRGCRGLTGQQGVLWV